MTWPETALYLGIAATLFGLLYPLVSRNSIRKSEQKAEKENIEIRSELKTLRESMIFLGNAVTHLTNRIDALWASKKD